MDKEYLYEVRLYPERYSNFEKTIEIEVYEIESNGTHSITGRKKGSPNKTVYIPKWQVFPEYDEQETDDGLCVAFYIADSTCVKDGVVKEECMKKMIEITAGIMEEAIKKAKRLVEQKIKDKRRFLEKADAERKMQMQGAKRKQAAS